MVSLKNGNLNYLCTKIENQSAADTADKIISDFVFRFTYF